MNKSFAAATVLLLSVLANANASVMRVEQSAFNGATVINFDNLATQTGVTTQYAAQGVTNFNATVLGSSGYPHTTDSYPGHSGSNAVYFGASIELATATDRVGAWMYKFNGTQYVTALDSTMNVLMSVAADTASRDSAYYDFVGIQSSSANIAYVIISNKDMSTRTTWDIGGYTTFFDDFTFGASSQAVPEPATPALLGLGLLSLVALRRKKAKAI